jgi:transcriptional regulator with XRE-family HTH domain
MTVREPQSFSGKVNQEPKPRVKMDELNEAWRRAVSATAGASNAIADHTYGLFGEREYDLRYVTPKAGLLPTAATTIYFDPSLDDDLRFDWVESYPQMYPLELGGGISIVGSQPNAESVVEYLIPTDPTPVNVDPVAEYRTARRVAAEGQRDALAHISKNLDATTAVYAQDAPQDVIRRLTDLGVSQLSIARALGVTPTAVRKWRRGETAKSDHRARLARFAAMYSLLTETGLHDPAGWLDIPISRESTLTPLELFISGRADITVLLGARLLEPQEALDGFDPEWRQTYPVDPDYEVVMLQDGSRSAVPRKKDGGV